MDKPDTTDLTWLLGRVCGLPIFIAILLWMFVYRGRALTQVRPGKLKANSRSPKGSKCTRRRPAICYARLPAPGLCEAQQGSGAQKEAGNRKPEQGASSLFLQSQSRSARSLDVTALVKLNERPTGLDWGHRTTKRHKPAIFFYLHPHCLRSNQQVARRLRY